MGPPLPRIVSLDEAGEVLATFIPSTKAKRDDGSTADTDHQVRIDVIRPPSTPLHLLHTRLLAHFLPSGYPLTVSADYTAYQVYDSLQALLSSVASPLTSRAVLSTIGVGSAGASPTLAILLSLVQDQLGRASTILFAARFGTALEPECKRFRLAADVFNDLAMLLDLLSPVLGGGAGGEEKGNKVSRVLVLSAAAGLRALCGVSAGGAKASLSAHFALRGNLGEVSAKDGSQETVVGLVGTLLGGWVVSRVAEGRASMLVLVGLLVGHLWANWMAVRSVALRTLNRQRMGMVSAEWIATGGRVMGVEEVSRRERVFEWDGIMRDGAGRGLGWCRIGVSFEEYLGSVGKSQGQGGHAFTAHGQALDGLCGASSDGSASSRRYLIHVDGKSRHGTIALQQGCTTRDQLKAWFTVCKALQQLDEQRKGNGVGDGDKARDKSGSDDDDERSYAASSVQEAQVYADQAFPLLSQRLEEAGWDLNTGALETGKSVRFARLVEA